MDFATVSPTMSRSPELFVPRPRRPKHDILQVNQEDSDSKHPLVAHLEKDDRWPSLSRYLQVRVLDTAMQVHLMTREEVDIKITELDNQILFSPYLNALSRQRGTLREQHDEMVDISSTMLEGTILLEELGIPSEGAELIPYLFSQIHLAERLLGRRLEKDREIVWRTNKGFADPLADIAIELCMEAVSKTRSPNIY